MWIVVWSIGGGSLAAAAPAPGADSVASAGWRRLEVPIDGPLTAVALGPGGERLAVGGEGVVAWRAVPAADAGAPGAPTSLPPWRRATVRGVVSDLRYDAGGTLWVATTDGLLTFDPSGRRREASPAPGDDARRIHRIVLRSGFVLVATEAGAFVRAPGSAWQRIVEGVPRGPVVALAARPTAPPAKGGADARSLEVWLVAGERLHRVTLAAAAGAVEVGAARRVDVPGWPTSQTAVDLATSVAGDAFVVLFTRSFVRTLAAAVDDGRPRLEVVHPVWPPGAVARRLSAEGRGVFVASDHGLLTASAWPDRWQRAAQPAGSLPIRAVAAHDRVVYAVGGGGLWRGEGEAPTPPAAPPPVGAAQVPRDPALRLVHEKALERAGLEPAYWQRQRRRLAMRGWLPELTLRAGAGYDRDTGHDYDESFTYGQLHRLNDRFNGRSRDFEGDLTLSWDFADVVYDPDVPDLSREARQVITLRDTILDEINQLYFDRRRTLAALARFADRRDPEAVALEIRARELAAGLDAWTGGWFSEQLDGAR